MDFGLFLDVFVIFVFLVSMVIAFIRGFIREVLTILGIAGGVLAAYIGGPALVPHVQGWLGITDPENPEKLMGIVPYTILADALAYGGILIVVVILLSIISHFIAEGVKNMGLGALDRTLGVVFGIGRAVLVLGLLYLLPYYLISEEQKQDLLGTSKTRVYLEATSEWIAGLLPGSTEEDVQDGADVVSETRKKLEEMNVLNSEGDDNNNMSSGDDPLADFLGEGEDGYGPESREELDELIKKTAEESMLAPAPDPEQESQPE